MMEDSDRLDSVKQITEQYVLRLFIAGSSPISARAITNLRHICEDFLQNRYSLDIVDAHQQPELVKAENVTALPMLIKIEPGPKKRLIGDFSDQQKVLRGLGINT
jgi:circadian clock protein KaiB